MIRKYVIEALDGSLKIYKSGGLFGKRVSGGKVVLGGITYTVDPTKVRLLTKRPKLAPWTEKIVSYLFYRENDPTPIPYFNAMDSPADGLTGKIFKTLLTEKTIDEMRGGNMKSWIPVLMLIIGIVIGTVMMYAGSKL